MLFHICRRNFSSLGEEETAKALAWMGRSFQQRMTKRPRLDQQHSGSSCEPMANHFRKQVQSVSHRKQRYQNPIFRAVKYIKDRPWTSYDLSHEFFSTYRTLSQSQPRTRQLLHALTAKMIECPHHLKVDDISAIMYSIDKCHLMCPTFADFLFTFSKSLSNSPDRITPKAAFHALYFIRNKITQDNHFIDTVKIHTDLSEEDYKCLKTFEKFAETIAIKVKNSKLGPTFQVSCQTIHQYLNPTRHLVAIDNHDYAIDYNYTNNYNDNYKSNGVAVNPATLDKVIDAAYKCFRVDKNVLSVMRASLREQFSLPGHVDLLELGFPDSAKQKDDNTYDHKYKIRLLQAIWKLPNIDLPHSCVLVAENNDIHIKYNDITIDPSIQMLKQQIVALLCGGTLSRTTNNEIYVNNSLEFERICVIFYDILELRRFYGRSEDIQEYIHTKLVGDVQMIIRDCIKLKHKYFHQVDDSETSRIFEEIQNMSTNHSDSSLLTEHNVEKVISFSDLKKILGNPVEREEPKFYMRGLFLR